MYPQDHLRMLNKNVKKKVNKKMYLLFIICIII